MAACLPVIVAVLSLVAAGSTAVPTLAPVDEVARQPDFLAFRQELQLIVDRQDLPALFQVVDPKIRHSFGGDEDGAAGLKRYWESQGDRLWSELRWVLAHGGTFQGPDSFTAPYVFARWPEEVDAFEHVALVGSGVRICSAPAAQAPVLYRACSHKSTGAGG